MSRVHAVIAALVPLPRRHWIEAHAAELGSIESPRARRRWMMGLIPLATRALWAQLHSEPRSFLGGTLAIAVAVTISIINALGGTGLLILYFTGADRPPLLLVLALVLAVQSGSTLVVVLGLFRSTLQRILRIHRAGSAAALLIGIVGFSVGLAANLHPINGDPEYGPPTVALMIAAHGLASLLAFTTPRDPGLETA